MIKTKIIITVGKPKSKFYDSNGNIYEECSHRRFLEMFVDRNGNFIPDVIRINMAYFKDGGHNELDIIEALRYLQNEMRNNRIKYKPIGLLADLPGPKIRIDDLENVPLELVRGEKFYLYWNRRRINTDPRGASVLVYDEAFTKIGNFNSIAQDIHKETGKTIISLGDGQVVLGTTSDKVDPLKGIIECEVLISGQVRNLMGLTIRGFDLDVPACGIKDRESLNFLLENALDKLAFIGVSFVRSVEDIINVKRLIYQYFRDKYPNKDRAKLELISPGIIAKIETREGYKNIEEILDIADGIMIARGDLGLQFEPSELPAIQKEIINICNLRGKPVITATQMLNSMQFSRRPTRAEPNDVFNAIIDGSDAVMLSDETAQGQFPRDAVDTLLSIAKNAEKYYFKNKEIRKNRVDYLLSKSEKQIKDFRERLIPKVEKIGEVVQIVPRPGLDQSEIEFLEDLGGILFKKLWKNKRQLHTNLISNAAWDLAEVPEIESIITTTASGRSARMLSRFRPRTSILAATYDHKNAQKLMLSFGVYPYDIVIDNKDIKQKESDPEEVAEKAIEEAIRKGYLNKEYEVIYVGGTPIREPGTTNLIHIRQNKY